MLPFLWYPSRDAVCFCYSLLQGHLKNKVKQGVRIFFFLISFELAGSLSV